MSHSRGDKAGLSFDRIRLFGDPVLKQESKEIAERGPELDRLAKLMFEVMDREGGIGLAAPQIGIQRKIMVWRHPDTEQGYVLLNPRIVERSQETETASEGCLSLPGLRGLVPRHAALRLVGLDAEGGEVRLDAEGFHARVIQHEHDHLDGIVFVDRMADMSTLMFEEEWEQFAPAGDLPVEV